MPPRSGACSRTRRGRGRGRGGDVAQLVVIVSSLQRGDVTKDDEFPQVRLTAAEIRRREPAGVAPPTEEEPPEDFVAEGAIPDPLPAPEEREPIELLMDVLALCAVIDRERRAYRSIPTERIREVITTGWQR
jgi:hypothetical protein